MKNKLYHYVECGLDDVFLTDGYTLEKDGTLFVQNIHGLHRAIGQHLVFLGRKLKGKEIRFIRHYLDLSQKAFGQILGVDYQTVLRWESSQRKIPKTAEFLLRAYFAEYLSENSRIQDLIDRLSDLDNNRKSSLELSLSKGEWRNKAA